LEARSRASASPRSEAGAAGERPYRPAAGLGSFLPFRFRETEDGRVDAGDAEWAVPSAITDTIENLERLADPRSYMGRTPEEALDNAVGASASGMLDLLGVGSPAALARAASRGAGVDAPNSRSNSATDLYNFGEVQGISPKQRPFEEDYPNAEGLEAGDRLTHDIDGRPLDPEGRVVGRRVVGGPEEGLGREELAGVAEEGTGRPVASGQGSDGSLGWTSYNPTTLKPTQVAIDSSLSAEDATRVLYHEVGHVIDQFAGEIDASDLSPELDRVFSALNTGSWRERGLVGPADWGYDEEAAPRELMAEAIRAYMLDPN
jgi:hypothetical protein